MSSTDRLERLFRAALLLPKEEREEFLQAACADDPVLCRQLERLLAADEAAEAESFLDEPAAGLVEPADFTNSAAKGKDSPPDELIGPYRLRRLLCRGGMGDVYLALQERPFKRYVAVKLIRPGLDTEAVLERFEAERQILASLSHPNIARLIDGGITPAGLPYFTMEYVEGLPLTTYCDEQRLDIDERLRLFEKVCHVVHYAHQNLVLHRDLKPSNILVTEDGTVKLLDFGVARLLNPHLTPISMPDSQAEMRLMTPEYASPEQVRGLGLTTASDVYSLGVVLYELLTGCLPHEFEVRSPDAIGRVLTTEEPIRPSTRLTGHAAPEPSRAAEIGRARGLEPGRLTRKLRGDLDDIVLTAIRKEPGRRYASAEQLAEDIRRYLAGRPIFARPGTPAYRVRKFVARHRWPVVAAALILISLVAGLGTALRMADIARQERRAAHRAETHARAVAEQLIGLFESSDPWQSPEDARWADAFLARGIDRANALENEPLLQSRFLDAIGRVYEHLGRYAEAQEVLERALDIRQRELGEDHVDLAEIMNHLGWVHYRRGQYANAERLYRRALAIQTAALGANDPALADTYTRLGYIPHTALDTSIAYFQRALDLRLAAFGQEHPDIPSSMALVGLMLSRKGRTDEAESHLRGAVDLRRRLFRADIPALALSYFQLADLLARDPTRVSESEQLYRDGLTLLDHSFGRDHLGRAHGLSNLAILLDEENRFDEAAELYRESLRLRTAIFGDRHATVAEARAHLGAHLFRRGRLEDAEGIHREALMQMRQILGPRHRSVAWQLANLADVLVARGELDEAERHLREAVSIRLEAGGSSDLTYAEALGRLARVHALQGDHARAEELYLESVSILSAQLPDHHPPLQRAYSAMAELYTAQNRLDEAATYRAKLVGR